MNQSEDKSEEMHSYFENQSPALSTDEDSEQLTPMCQPRQQKQHSDNNSLLSRIRQNFSVSHFLGYYPREPDDGKDDETVSTPIASQDSSTPARRLSSLKNVFSSSRSDAHSRSNTSNSTCSVSSSSSHPAPGRQSGLDALSTQTSIPGTLGTFDSQLVSPALTMTSLPDDTPPMTPCLPAGEASHSDIVVDPENENQREASIKIRDDKHDESKKGKEPAPPFPYETLIADISGPVEPQMPEVLEQSDNSEWWGLEYMIELSRKDSRASDASEETGGEHSKSRESWAAIHQGIIPPVCEDTNFHEWQKWHRSLDKLELKKRKRRTIEFVEESDRQANIFVYEMQARRALELYEDRLTDEEIYDVLLWIEYTSEQRQDPFDPAETHGLGWVLKNHRSLASLRELAVPPLT